MLKNVRFCYCTQIDKNKEVDTSCMIFGFSKKAQKILSDEFLYEIFFEKEEDKKGKTGIECGSKRIVFIKKIGENKYRLPVKNLECFLKCLFKYLPAKYQSPEEREEVDCNFS